MRIELWVDGSGAATGGPGGYGYVLRAINNHGEVRRTVEGSGGIPGPDCTNQRAELTAAIEGLRAITKPTVLTLYSDSEYVVNGFVPTTGSPDGWVQRWEDNGWLNRDENPVANQGLWRALAAEVARHTAVTWVHVLGHARVEHCTACMWTQDAVPNARHRECPRCHAAVKADDKYPLNARCDKLAGQERKALKHAAVGAALADAVTEELAGAEHA